MESIIKSDLYRYLPQKYTFQLLLKGFRIPGFFFTFLIRKASLNKKHSIIGIFLRLLLRRYSYKFGFHIPLGTKIGKGFYIGHFGNIVISSRSIIGDNCNITHGVTIGAINRGDRKGAPEIGNFVWMGAHCILVGNIKIGSNVLIAPGAFVNFDVPNNSIVIGNPGKIIQKPNPTDSYINNYLV